MDAWDDFGINASQCNGNTGFVTGTLSGSLPSWRPGYTLVRKGIVDQWEQLHNDQNLKDVEVMLSDGAVIMADSLVLKVASPIFRQQLEEAHKLPDAELNLEGDLLKTQECDEKAPVTVQESTSPPCDGCLRVRVNSTAAEFRFFLRLLYTGRMDPTEWPVEEPCFEHEQLPMLPGSLVSQPPATSEPVLPLDGRHHLSGPMPGPPLVHPLEGFMQTGSMKGKGKGTLRRAPSITLLLAAAALARTYQVHWLLHVLIEVMKERITEVSFDSILCGAVAYDITPLRLAALDFAQRSCEVWRRYRLREYSPEVLFELQSLYPSQGIVGLNDASDIMGI